MKSGSRSPIRSLSRSISRNRNRSLSRSFSRSPRRSRSRSKSETGKSRSPSSLSWRRTRRSPRHLTYRYNPRAETSRLRQYRYMNLLNQVFQIYFWLGLLESNWYILFQRFSLAAENCWCAGWYAPVLEILGNNLHFSWQMHFFFTWIIALYYILTSLTALSAFFFFYFPAFVLIFHF